MTLPSLSVSRNGIDQTSADNLNTYCQTCNSVTDLRAFIGISGIQVFMRGFVTPGDGGQGNFYWNSTGTGPDDGGVTTIVPNGSIVGCWSRIVATGIGNGTVTQVSVTTANGISGTVTNPTTTPAITLALGAITPSSVAASGTILGSNLSGTNTGDQTITLTNDVTGSGTGTFAATIANNAVSSTKFRQSAPVSVVGNPANSIANVTDIAVSAGNQILASNAAGTTISFRTFDAIPIGQNTPAAGSFSTLTAEGAVFLTPIGANAIIAVDSGQSIQLSYDGGAAFLSLSSSGIIMSGSNNGALFITSNVTVGFSALATTATTGFLWIPSCPGAPTGVATAPYSNAVALIYDSSNNFLYIRCGGTWRKSTVYA